VVFCVSYSYIQMIGGSKNDKKSGDKFGGGGLEPKEGIERRLHGGTM
jgi:hypothetical protein